MKSSISTRPNVVSTTATRPKVITPSSTCAVRTSARRRAERNVTMPNTLTPTKARGAQTKANEMLYVELAQQITDEDLERQLAASGLNGPFVADVLSAMLTHERCGTHLYRAVAARANNPMLKGKYEEFGKETARHVDILEELITRMG